MFDRWNYYIHNIGNIFYQGMVDYLIVDDRECYELV